MTFEVTHDTMDDHHLDEAIRHLTALWNRAKRRGNLGLAMQLGLSVATLMALRPRLYRVVATEQADGDETKP